MAIDAPRHPETPPPAGSLIRPVVSVCVVTYNHADYIRECLESVLRQQVSVAFEILVGVDVSTDGTAERVKEMAERFPLAIRPFFHGERQGAAGNVRFLMSRAKGEFIAHLDGDDAWMPGKLAAQLEMFVQHPEVVAVYCNANVVEAGGNGTLLGRFSDAPTSIVSLERLMRRGNFLNNSSLLFRASARPSLLALPDEYLDFRSHLTLAALGPLGYLDEPYVTYRWSTPGSLVSQANERVRRLYWEALAGVPEASVPRAVRRAANADFLRRVAFRSLRTRDWGLWQTWWDSVSRATGGRWLLGLAVMASIAKEAARQLYAAIFMRSAGRRVFYFHGGQ